MSCPPPEACPESCPAATSEACCPSKATCEGTLNCLGAGGQALECCPANKNRREKRWKQCNFLKPCIDVRIYRNGEAMCVSYAGHIPGEQYIHGRNLPTTTTFAKRRLCQYTPYEFVDPDGCCSFCTYP